SIVAAIFVALAVGLAPGVARAETPRELRYDTAIDGAITLAGGAAWIASELLKRSLAPVECRWCDRDADGRSTLNDADASVRDALRLPGHGAAVASNLVGFIALPASMYGIDALAAQRGGHLDKWPVDALIITQAAVLAADVNQLAKLVFGRERP